MKQTTRNSFAPFEWRAAAFAATSRQLPPTRSKPLLIRSPARHRPGVPGGLRDASPPAAASRIPRNAFLSRTRPFGAFLQGQRRGIAGIKMQANGDGERRWSPSPGAECGPRCLRPRHIHFALDLSISQLLQQTRGLKLPSRAGDSPAARLPQNCGRNLIIPLNKLRIFIPTR